ncbi:polysaccharide biosynthesis protein [Skermania sp. ID1734]|uniref:polysaccharide biosynthesis protein n=1 Tax=Skermania sp. ID1734 TaxID=2597516 RepID=UPI00163DCF4A|nr:polysaccharide biosynthesis protein [Skermania sp. ID1734]
MAVSADSRSAVTGMTWVTVGAITANAGGYLLYVLASRWLGVSGYSEFASLLAAQLVLCVPALALQTVVAREVVRGQQLEALRRLTLRCAGLVAVLAALLVPVLSVILHAGVLATAGALLAAPVLVVLSGEQGLLQGSGRFRELAVLLALAGVGRIAPAVVALGLGAGSAVALIASAVGSFAVTVGARRYVGSPDAVTVAITTTVRSVLMASQVQLALIALSSVDVMIARIVLEGESASRYAAGAVVTKVAFWLPQAVGVVLYPRMAHPQESARALRSALAILGGLGAVTVAAAAVGAPLLPFIVGDAYAPVQGLLWAFAANGALLTILQGALLAAIAGERTRLALVAWLGLAVEIAVMLAVARTVGELIATAVSTALVTTTVVCALALAGTRSGVAPSGSRGIAALRRT